jgi:acetyltransferase-like isoleucine patch superfamily enzyme
MRSQIEWQAWMEDLNHLHSSPPVFARPVGLGSLGSESYFTEPYKIRAPHRVHIGDNVMIGERAILSVIDGYKGGDYDAVLRIGDHCEIASDLFLHCAGEVEIGDRVGISARVAIVDSGRDDSDPETAAVDRKINEPAPVRIHEGAVIGFGAIVMPGVTIGERAAVGAGSVVTRDVPPRCIVFGNPARIIRSWDEDSKKWIAGPPKRR